MKIYHPFRIAIILILIGCTIFLIGFAISGFNYHIFNFSHHLDNRPWFDILAYQSQK